LGVLHVTITLTDADRASRPVPRHALLISDNPSSAPPRRILTRLDGTADLELRMSTLETPHTTQEVIAARSELVAPMDVTAGSLNYAVPATVDPTQFRSLYIWCVPINSAYAAATLVPPR